MSFERRLTTFLSFSARDILLPRILKKKEKGKQGAHSSHLLPWLMTLKVECGAVYNLRLIELIRARRSSLVDDSKIWLQR